MSVSMRTLIMMKMQSNLLLPRKTQIDLEIRI